MAQLPKGSLVFGAMINQYLGVAIAIDPFQVVSIGKSTPPKFESNGPRFAMMVEPTLGSELFEVNF